MNINAALSADICRSLQQLEKERKKEREREKYTKRQRESGRESVLIVDERLLDNRNATVWR